MNPFEHQWHSLVLWKLGVATLESLWHFLHNNCFANPDRHPHGSHAQTHAVVVAWYASMTVIAAWLTGVERKMTLVIFVFLCCSVKLLLLLSSCPECLGGAKQIWRTGRCETMPFTFWHDICSGMYTHTLTSSLVLFKFSSVYCIPTLHTAQWNKLVACSRVAWLNYIINVLAIRYSYWTKCKSVTNHYTLKYWVPKGVTSEYIHFFGKKI